MRLVLLFTTTTLLLTLVSAQLQVKKLKLNSCDVTAYQEVIYNKDNLGGADTYTSAETFEACVEKCSARSDCKAVNYIETDNDCSIHGSGLTSPNAPKSLYVSFPDSVHAVISCSRKSSIGCGTQAAEYKPLINKNLRIIGGSEAKPHSWPWLLFTVTDFRDGSGKGSTCGSVLLRVKDGVEKSDIVVTAAHCVTKEDTMGTIPEAYPANQITIFAGDHRRSEVEKGEQRRTGAQVRFHSRFLYTGQTGAVYDIAIIKLAVPLDFTDTVRPICLPKAGEAIPVGQTCVAAGWGRINKSNRETPDALLQVLAPAQSAQTCRKGYGSIYKEDIQICAGTLDGSSGVCSGDSGGMLACQSSDASWKLHGVTSYVVNDACVKAGYPGVFTRVSGFIDWISKNMNEMTSIK